MDYRRSFADLRSCRMIFAESDRLPALIVDSFGDVLVLQCLALGMERFKRDQEYAELLKTVERIPREILEAYAQGKNRGKEERRHGAVE